MRTITSLGYFKRFLENFFNRGCCSIKYQFFMRTCFKFGTDGWYCVTKGKIRLFPLGFCVRTAFLFSNVALSESQRTGR